VLDLSEAVEERIKSAFDMTKIGRDVLMKGAVFSDLCSFLFLLGVCRRSGAVSSGSGIELFSRCCD